MTTIDPTTSIGKLRLRCGDFGDIPFLPDSVYTQTLVDNGGSLPQAAITCATYILGMLAFKVDRKMSLQLQVWGSQAFKAYKEFLLLTISNPNLMQINMIIPNDFGTDLNPIVQFASDWNANYVQFTNSQQLSIDAIGSASSSADGTWNWIG